MPIARTLAAVTDALDAVRARGGGVVRLASVAAVAVFATAELAGELEGRGIGGREGTGVRTFAGTTDGRSIGRDDGRSTEGLEGRSGGGGGVKRRKLGRAGGGGRVGGGTLACGTAVDCATPDAGAGILGFAVEGRGGAMIARDQATCEGGGRPLDRNGAGFGFCGRVLSVTRRSSASLGFA